MSVVTDVQNDLSEFVTLVVQGCSCVPKNTSSGGLNPPAASSLCVFGSEFHQVVEP